MIRGKIVIEPVKSLRISYVNPGSDEEDPYTYKGRMYHTAKTAAAEYMIIRRHKYDDWNMSEERWKRFQRRVTKVFKRYLP